MQLGAFCWVEIATTNKLCVCSDSIQFPFSKSWSWIQHSRHISGSLIHPHSHSHRRFDLDANHVESHRSMLIPLWIRKLSYRQSFSWLITYFCFVFAEISVLFNVWSKMQRAEVTVEELLLEKAIKDECQWENLPRRLQQTVPSKEEWITRYQK